MMTSTEDPKKRMKKTTYQSIVIPMMENQSTQRNQRSHQEEIRVELVTKARKVAF
jgi:hypothetical protein